MAIIINITLNLRKEVFEMMWVKQVEPKFPITCGLLHYHNIIEIIFKNLFIF